MFSPMLETNFNIWVTFILSSVISFILDQSKLLLFGKELTSFSNILFSETTHPILMKLHNNISALTLFRIPSKNFLSNFLSQNFDRSRNMALVKGGYLYHTEMKKYLLWNQWSGFEMMSQKYSYDNPFKKLLAKFWSIKKHDSGEWDLLALYGHEEILLNSYTLKRLIIFWNNFTEMFLGRPF